MGHAFYGVANLLINRGKHLLPALHSTTLTQAETLYKRVNGVISFVAENPVRAIASHTQVWLSRWYKEVRTPSPVPSSQTQQKTIVSNTLQNSLVFVSYIHGIWNNLETKRKASKRYGHLIHSPKAGLSEMLMHHREEVFKWIEDRADEEESEREEEEEEEKEEEEEREREEKEQGQGKKNRSPTKDKTGNAAFVG